VHDEAFVVHSEGIATCTAIPQDGATGSSWSCGVRLASRRVVLGSFQARRDAVTFAAPRVRVAHLDTGYDPNYESLPKHLLRELGRSFVEVDPFQNSAVDPDNKVFLLDNSRHGTGTLGILARGTGGRRAKRMSWWSPRGGRLAGADL
jgi:hypothetical protein